MLKSKLSLSRHFVYANEQITYHFWLCVEMYNADTCITVVGKPPDGPVQFAI